MRTFATILAFAASAMAYSVTAPTNATGFSTSGQNTVSWNMVSTDAANFTIVLSNQQVNPPVQQILAALVVGTLGTIQVNPPSTGWPTGSGYQINLVANSQQLSSILAQSDQFSFHAPTSSSGSSSSLPTTSLVVPPTFSGQSTSPSASSPSGSDSSSDLNPSTSDTSVTPQNTNAAASMGVQTAFFGAVALVGALLV